MKYTIVREIEQPVSKIAELFGEPENLAYWQPGFQSIETLDEQRHRLLYHHGKAAYEVEMIETVEVDDLPREYTSSFETKGMKIRVVNRFEEAGDNRTRWISRNEGKVSGFMMRIIATVMPGCFKKQSAKFMDNFKAFAEHGADVREGGKA